jgi:hypothetical protein
MPNYKSIHTLIALPVSENFFSTYEDFDVKEIDSEFIVYTERDSKVDEENEPSDDGPDDSGEPAKKKQKKQKA